MLLGARQGCVHGESLNDRMSTLKELNYDFLELALSKDEINELNGDSVRPYQALIEETGLAILSTSMGHFTDFFAHDEAGRQQILDDIRRMIAFTHEIGADAILLATTESADRSIAEYQGFYRDSLSPLADEALQAGITFAFEHVGWYRPHTLAQLVRAIGHPAVGVYFDMGNCLYVGENPLAEARVCAPVTVQLHVKGGPTTPLGAMPLAPIREILQTAGFQGRACLEIPALANNRHLAEARALLTMAGYSA